MAVVLVLGATVSSLSASAQEQEVVIADSRIGPPTNTLEKRQAAAALATLVNDYEAWNLAQSPISAGQNGDRAALSKLPDVSLATDMARKKDLEAFQARLNAIPAASLDAEGQLNRAFLARIIGDQLTGLSFDAGRFAFTSDDGFHLLAPYLATVTPLNSVADAEAWIDRLEALPKYYDDNIANARRGVKTGWVQPLMITKITIGQAQTALRPAPGDDPLLAPFATMGAAIPADRRAALKARAIAVIRDQIRPAQQRFLTFLNTEYLPKSKPALGVGGLPGGKPYYAFLARRFTTTSLTPAEIHALGQREVARIRAEMDAVRTQSGFKGTHAEFLAFLRGDPRFYVTTREALLEKASEVAKRIDDQLPRYFGTLPRLPYGVRPVPAEIEKGYTSARYFPGSASQGVAGGYMVNTYALDQRGLYELPALTLHEAVPGHHLQIALAQELQGVPAFRRDADMTAFVEGWALYAESLGTEMGIYRTPYETFGRLSMEMWRACRLVSDTGIHWLGWSLDEARECFTDNTALSALNIENELARYVGWPGQALGYKVGELKIQELRKRAETALGDRFDIRRFHDAVLLAGPLPMDLLEARVDAWIAAKTAKE